MESRISTFLRVVYGFCNFNKNLSRFWWTMGYETHLNISQKVFADLADLFLYTTVVKWSCKNKIVFVFVKCNYVTVALMYYSTRLLAMFTI